MQFTRCSYEHSSLIVLVLKKKAMTYFNFWKNTETHRSVVKKFDRSPSEFARLLDHPNVDVEYEKLYTKNTKNIVYTANIVIVLRSPAIHA